MGQQPIHWADNTAFRIIKQLGDKDKYVLASGITPSGVVHFGNFREVITVDFIARALRDKGKEVRFIFSWDDFDTFRKIPKNMPKQDELEKYMFQPIVDTPDPFEKEESYAKHHESNFEKQLEKVGIDFEPLYQANLYRKGTYTELVKTALKKANVIRDILNEHRSTPLDEEWLPVSIYCEHCNRDKMAKISFDGEKILSYECELCGHKGDWNIEQGERVKLPWRIDWPMRWAFEGVDFEPGGKDHSSQGGSYTTAKEIVKAVYDKAPPIYLQYDFVSIKGGGGKMSSSSGEVVTVDDVLNVYPPEMVRWIFASYRPNVDFSVSFDLDAIKNYEDFDRQERLAYGVDTGNAKKQAMAKRVMELSSVGPQPETIPFRPPFRHLTNLLQINEGDLEKTKLSYQQDLKTETDLKSFTERAKCALFWLEHYAPEEFKFALNATTPNLDLNETQTSFMKDLAGELSSNMDNYSSDKELHEKIYEIIHKWELVPNEVFPLIYQTLISKEKGPKLASFIRTIGKEKISGLFSTYLS